MFFSTNLNDIYSEYYFFPGFSDTPEGRTSNYSINTPYTLIFTSVHPDEPSNYFSTCFIAPEAYLYSQNSKDETGMVFNKVGLHKHNFFELMFVLSGEVYVNIENERHLYKEGNCCILNKNVMHTEEYNTNFSIVFLQLSTNVMKLLNDELSLQFFNSEKLTPYVAMNEFVKNNLSNDTDTHKAYVDFIPINTADNVAQKLHDYFDKITNETLNPKIGSTITVLSLIKRLFLYMSLPDIFSTTPVQIGSSAEYSLFSEIVSAMEETHGRISRSQLSEKLNYSGTYLNEICKKYSGLTLFDYGMTFCMKAAAHMLTTTTDNITEIASALGFSNQTHFYKIFKKVYGITPAEYRRTK